MLLYSVTKFWMRVVTLAESKLTVSVNSASSSAFSRLIVTPSIASSIVLVELETGKPEMFTSASRARSISSRFIVPFGS